MQNSPVAARYGHPILQFHLANRAFQVYAAGSEDMDTLTFNTPILFRHLTFSEAKKQPILEVDLKKALDGLGMTMSQVREQTFLTATFSDDSFLQFIELCLLLGCDYLEQIKGVGPKTAYKLMQEHGSLDEVLEHLKAKSVLVCSLIAVGLT